MKGKVFKDSADVYQAQAKILFDFYKDAAEHIVEEETAIDKQIQQQKEILQTGEDASNATLGITVIWSIVGIAGIVVLAFWNLVVGIIILLPGLVGIFISQSKQKKINQNKESVNDILDDLNKKKKNIFRNYRIDKLGVIYVPVAKKMPFEGKSILIDYTGDTADYGIEMQQANHPQELAKTIHALEALSLQAPLVEGDKETEEVDTDNYSSSIQHVKLYDYFGALDRTLRAGSFHLSDVSMQQVFLPLVKPDAPFVRILEEYGTTDCGQAPIIPVFDMHCYDSEIAKFNSLNDSRKATAEDNDKFEDILKSLIQYIGIAVQTIATLKVASNNKLVDESNKLLFTILKNSYNHYSPLLEHDEIEKMRKTDFDYSESDTYKPFQLKASSRVRYDVLKGNWVAEDGSVTTMPFGISQLQEEIVSPIVQNLLNETRIERMRIYNKIKDQKLDYFNQWHRETNDFYARNRTSSDEVKHLMRANMTSFLAAQSTLQGLENIKKTMKEQLLSGKENSDISAFTEEQNDAGKLLAAFEIQSQQFKQAQEDFDDFMERLQEDINAKAASFKYIEYYDASLRDRLAKDLVSAGDEINKLDERRRPLANINPLYAKTSTLPPKPSVDASVSEQMSQNVAQLARQSLNELK